ncbi:general stress protein [Sphingoaurantiacus capsulatus]|uniref:General stress protein n=1 Tax=Sphingoaurantiacus capsulatus TaxID=1771310 RepID=A0ABV7X9B7_9SPHN
MANDDDRISARGFGSMDPDRHREVSRRGGQISRGGGFAANPELAREAGRKGGLAGSHRLDRDEE